MSRTHLIASLVSALTLGSAVTLVVQRVRAAGIPPTGALTYAGLLQDATGQPLTGTQFIEVKFWNDAAASAAANLLCDTGSPAGIGLVNGRFSIPLPDACTTKVGANPGIWVEVLEGSAANSAASLGRTKVGAVPFAVEANHAASADTAAAGGALANQLATIQADVHPASAFHAWLTNATSIPPTLVTVVPFDHVEFDLAGEYTAATGTFAPKQAGYYLVQCGIEFYVSATTAWSAFIYRNHVQVGGADLTADAATGVSPATSAVFKLAAGDLVQCVAFQQSPAAQPLVLGSPARNSFSVARLY